MTSEYKVCPFQHDHYMGDGYDDCLAAYATELARAHARGWHGDGLPRGRCPDCDAGAPASNPHVLPSGRAHKAFLRSVAPCLNCDHPLRDHDRTTHGCPVDRPDDHLGPLVTVTHVELGWSPDYDRLTFSCGHTYEPETDPDNASLVGAETHCEACGDRARGK